MHKLLYFICDELDELEQKAEKDGKLSMAEIQYGDVLAHFKKNLLSSEEMMEEMDGASSYRGRSSYEDGYSNARGRGSGAKRYANGRYAPYSRDDGSYDGSYDSGRSYRRGGYSRADGNQEYIENLRSMMDDAPDEKTRQSIQRMISQMEQQ